MPRLYGTARISPCGRYRYELTRVLHPSSAIPLGTCVFVMLRRMPTRTTTIRRCKHFATRHGYSDLVIVNLYAWRSTDPDAMWTAHAARGQDIIGPDNDAVIAAKRDHSGSIVCAWGKGGDPARVARVVELLGGADGLLCLKTNLDGSPVHPLYQPNNATFVPWEGMP